MNVGSLFTGIGGFDLGLERAGMRVVWQCEQNPYRRAVLGLRWPGVPCHPNVQELDPRAVEPVDVLCGGFPCVDISNAGKRAGIDGPGSRLWAEMFRLVRGLRPRYVLVENVSALLGRGMGRVLGDLSSVGYDAEWDCLRAADFGAPHLRDRVWIVAYPDSDRGRQQGSVQRDGNTPRSAVLSPLGDDLDRLRADVPDAEGSDGKTRCGVGSSRGRRPSAPTGGLSSNGLAELWSTQSPWAAGEPNVDRMAHGLPSQVDRIAALGDSLVPQIAEWIGCRLMVLERGEATKEENPISGAP